MVAPRLATPAIDGQQRLHARERLVGELQHHAGSWLVGFQERDATRPQYYQPPSAAVVLIWNGLSRRRFCLVDGMVCGSGRPALERVVG
jgi:hypothetical protein